MADEFFGAIDASKTYTHHALARLFGVADKRGECSKFILRNLLHEGLPFVKVGRLYLVNGHIFNLWIQEHSIPWEAWHDPDTKSSGEELENNGSVAGTTNSVSRGAKRRST